MRSRTVQIHRRLVFVELMTLAVALPAIAGAVNAAGFMVVGAYLSHVTGNLARIGDELAIGHFETAFGYAIVILAFFAGAVLATLLVEIAKRLNKPRYLVAMLLEGGLLGAFALISALTSPAWHQYNVALMCMLSMAMGLQNAMITRLSGAVVRTTHMTGIVTDIGIEAVQVAFVAKDSSLGKPLFQRMSTLLTTLIDVPARRLRLLSYILFSFIFGALTGPFVYLQIGYWGAVGPTLILFALAWLDYSVGIEWHPEAHFVPVGRPANQQFLALVAAELERNPEKAKAALDSLRKRTGLRKDTGPIETPAPDAAEVVLSPPGSPAAIRTPPHEHTQTGDSAPAADSLQASGVLKAPHGQGQT